MTLSKKYFRFSIRYNYTYLCNIFILNFVMKVQTHTIILKTSASLPVPGQMTSWEVNSTVEQGWPNKIIMRKLHLFCRAIVSLFVSSTWLYFLKDDFKWNEPGFHVIWFLCQTDILASSISKKHILYTSLEMSYTNCKYTRKSFSFLQLIHLLFQSTTSNLQKQSFRVAAVNCYLYHLFICILLLFPSFGCWWLVTRQVLVTTI